MSAAGGGVREHTHLFLWAMLKGNRIRAVGQAGTAMLSSSCTKNSGREGSVPMPSKPSWE